MWRRRRQLFTWWWTGGRDEDRVRVPQSPNTHALTYFLHISDTF